jgi:hypothetical protein
MADDMLDRDKRLKSDLRTAELNRAITQQSYDYNSQINPLRVNAALNQDALERWRMGEDSALPQGAPARRMAESSLQNTELQNLDSQLNYALRESATTGSFQGLVDFFSARGMQATPNPDGLVITGSDGMPTLVRYDELNMSNPVIQEMAMQRALTGARINSAASGSAGIPSLMQSMLGNSAGSMPAPAAPAAPVTPATNADMARLSSAVGQPRGPELTMDDVSAFKIQPNASIENFTPEMLRQAITKVESAGNPNAVSQKGAVGMMQILPSTAMDPGYQLPDIFTFAESLGVQVPSRDMATATALLRDPVINQEYGMAYLNAMLQKFGGDLDTALAAYNMGPAATMRHLQSNNGRLMPELLNEETRNYIPKVRAALAMYQ